ncbi:DegT/DnrJ/EryC1/StrS family aminotransferase [Shewanella algae]|uniref:DegT/DnrJ/EryC1/StrS family aminotransferase n=1 Tax=Shewanella algae TaxID=38313 RepID=UPI003004CA7C
MSFKVPLFDLNFDENETAAVVATIESKWLSMGSKCVELEEKFAVMCGSKRAVTVSNCTAALHLALMALDIKEGDEVIVPSLTFVATANCVRYVGATPIFADITSLDDLTISVEDISRKITSRTKAIIPMHFAGFPADMDRIMEISKKNGLKVIEDACHGPLSEYKGRKLGSIGDIGCFSFFSNKNISTGEGGMLITSDTAIADRVELLRSHGMTTMSYQRASGHATTYDVVDNGYNYRMDDIRASIGIVQVGKLQADLEKRAHVRDWYVDELKNVPSIIVPFQQCNEFSSNYIMPIILKDSTKEKRDSIRNILQEEGIQTSNHYPAVHRFSVFNHFDTNDLELTEYVADNEITLPMYSSLSKKQVQFIVKKLKEALQ